MQPWPDTAPTALAAAWERLRRRAWRSALFIVALAGCIALLLGTIQGRGYGSKFVYSLAMAMCCWLTHEAARLVHARLLDAWRRARGLATTARVHGWQGMAPAMVVSIAVGPAIGARIGDALTGFRTPPLTDWTSSDVRTIAAITLIASLVTMLVLSSRERLQAARLQAEAAQRQAAEHQLRLLQSQLEPHMLFNTLANLRVLIGLDPQRAQAMLDRLIAFLRSTLAASRAERRPLAAEFDRTADYLALMAVRMGERLRTRLDLPDALRAVPVPPLLLQPLVENAITHGLEPKVSGGHIDVSARAEGGVLTLVVQDDGLGPGGAPREGGGFGLLQVRERLATLYGTRATFTLEPAAGGGTRATVRLPLE